MMARRERRGGRRLARPRGLKREPICTECSHGERARRVDDRSWLNAPEEKLERFAAADWSWWYCGHCSSVWVVRIGVPGVVKLRIGYIDDATNKWHTVRSR